MTSNQNRMAVWLDSSEARIFHVTAESFDETIVHAPQHQIHRHAKDHGARSRSHPDDEQHYFREVSKHITQADAVLVVGPAMTKLHLLRWLRTHAPVIEARVVGLETVGHPTDRQIVAHVRSYFQPPASPTL